MREAQVGAYRLLTLAVASIVLVFVDAQTELLKPARAALVAAVTPFYHVARFPYVAASTVREALSSHVRLVNQNASLKRQLLEAQARTLRYEAVLEENDRLRELVGSSTRLRGNVLMAELLAVSDEPLEVVIDKGRLNGVEVGQAVIDSEGVFGQVVATSAFTSRVLLVTDVTHAVPVRVLHNDMRAIAVGDGVGKLVLKDVAVTLDIRQGDNLVSSGLGGRFPKDYPVGVVESVVRDQTESFADIAVVPNARLDRSRQVLVVFADEAEPVAAATSTAAPVDAGVAGELSE